MRSGVALDLGCGRSPYRELLAARGLDVRTLDIDDRETPDFVGTVEANGTWLAAQINIVDATHLDINVPFTHAWVSGGQIGGSLDALSFSLDSISNAAQAQLSAMSSAHQAGFFTGPNLEAILETEEQDSQGDMIFIGEGVILITNCKTVMGSIGFRQTAQDDVSYTTESQVNSRGYCPQLCEARYARGRLRFPFGATWMYARGIQPDVQQAGDT